MIALLPATARAGSGATVTWISNESGYWEVGSNWSTGSQPQAGDDVIIDRPGVAITVSIINATAAIRSLNTTEFLEISSTLTVTDTAFLDGGFQLSGWFIGGATVALRSSGVWSGSFSGVSVTVGAGHTLTIGSFFGSPSLSDATLTNQGTVVMTAYLGIVNGSQVVNAAGALWDVQGEYLGVSGDFNGTNAFTNAGTLRTGGSGSFSMGSYLAVVNTGTLQVQAGLFYACNNCNAMTSSGTLNISAGATIDLTNVTLQAGTTFAGGGTLAMPGTTTLNTSVTVTLPVTLTGQLTGNGSTLTLAAPMSLMGTVTGVNLTVGAGQTLTISTSFYTPTLSGATLTNHGTVAMTNGYLALSSGAQVVNAAGALWDVQGDFGLSGDVVGANAFTNAGTLRKSAGGGYFQLLNYLTFNNPGTLQIQTGLFGCACTAMTTSGVLSVSPGATLDLSNATLQAGSTFVGGGTLTIGHQGQTTLAASLTMTLPIVVTGVLTGNGATLTLAAPMTWSGGGFFNVGVTVPAGRTLTVNGGFAHHLSGATLTNHGTVNWTQGGSLALSNSAHIVNAIGALWDQQGGLTSFGSDPSSHTFTNAGTLRNSGPVGGFSLGIAFNNSGTVRIRLGGSAEGQSDSLSFGSVSLGGTLEVTLINGYVPTIHDRWNVLWNTSITGAFAVINGNGSQYSARYLMPLVSLRLVPPPNAELIRNGSFADQLNFWQRFSTPDSTYMVSSVVNGGFEFYRLPSPTPGINNQATVYQETDIYMPANAPLIATFDLSNTSSVRKRISVLIIESDFSDIAVCTFWLPANAPARNYGIRTHTTREQWNVSLYFYAASAGSNGGAYRIDNVSMKHDPNIAIDRTDCLDPIAPGPTVVADGENLLVNGDFNTGVLAPWFTFGTITGQVAGGVFEFIRPSGPPPSGVVLQPTLQAMTAGQLMTTTFDLGNSSSVRKRVTVLVHDRNFGDLAACTFWLTAGQPLSPYVLRAYATQAWTDATVSVYPATVGPDQWIRLDNVTLRRTPSAAIVGTECIEPGGAAANIARAQRSSGAISTTAPLSATASPSTAGDDARPAVLDFAGAIPLSFIAGTRLQFRSWLSATGRAEVQVSTDGVEWTVATIMTGSAEWEDVEVDLAGPDGAPVFVRFVLYPARDVVWRIDWHDVRSRGASAPRPARRN